MKWILPCLLLAPAVRADYGNGYFQPLPPNVPRVCLAGIDKGTLRIRHFQGGQLVPVTVAVVEVDDKGKPVQRTYAAYQRSQTEQVLSLSADVVVALDSQGKEIDPARLRELLRTERPVLVANEKPAPDVLRIMKPGAILLLVPVPLDFYGGYAVSPLTRPVLPADAVARN